jgi:hypothetical protein
VFEPEGEVFEVRLGVGGTEGVSTTSLAISITAGSDLSCGPGPKVGIVLELVDEV